MNPTTEDQLIQDSATLKADNAQATTDKQVADLVDDGYTQDQASTIISDAQNNGDTDLLKGINADITLKSKATAEEKQDIRDTRRQFVNQKRESVALKAEETHIEGFNGAEPVNDNLNPVYSNTPSTDFGAAMQSINDPSIAPLPSNQPYQSIASTIQSVMNSKISQATDTLFQTGIVTSIQTGSVTCQLEGTTANTPGILYLNTYLPQVNDQVVILNVQPQNGGFDKIIIGTVGTQLPNAQYNALTVVDKIENSEGSGTGSSALDVPINNTSNSHFVYELFISATGSGQENSAVFLITLANVNLTAVITQLSQAAYGSNITVGLPGGVGSMTFGTTYQCNHVTITFPSAVGSWRWQLTRLNHGL